MLHQRPLLSPVPSLRPAEIRRSDHDFGQFAFSVGCLARLSQPPNPYRPYLVARKSVQTVTAVTPASSNPERLPPELLVKAAESHGLFEIHLVTGGPHVHLRLQFNRAPRTVLDPIGFVGIDFLQFLRQFELNIVQAHFPLLDPASHPDALSLSCHFVDFASNSS